MIRREIIFFEYFFLLLSFSNKDMDEEELINEIAKLRELLHEKESALANIRRAKQIPRDHGLNNDEISRYSRQIFLPEIGVTGGVKCFQCISL